MLVFCTEFQHKRIPRTVTDKVSGKVSQFTAEDPSSMCFVNSDGQHVTPRKCSCGDFRPTAEDRQTKHYKERKEISLIAGVLYKDNGGNITDQTIPAKEFRRLMMAIHGKYDPNCPIEDAHEPIDNCTAV